MCLSSIGQLQQEVVGDLATSAAAVPNLLRELPEDADGAQ